MGRGNRPPVQLGPHLRCVLLRIAVPAYRRCRDPRLRVGEERLELDDAAYVDADLEQRGIARHRRDGQVAAVGASGAADRGGIREPGVRSRSSHGRSARTPRCRSSAVLVERVERGPVPGFPGRRVTRSAWAPRRATTERPVGSSANLSSSTALRAAINVVASGWLAVTLGRASSAAHSRLASVCR